MWDDELELIYAESYIKGLLDGIISEFQKEMISKVFDKLKHKTSLIN